MNLKNLKNTNLENKTIIIRADLDALNDKTGEIKNNLRLRLTARTVSEAFNKGAKNVVLCGHLGRPNKENRENLSVKNILNSLKQLIDREIIVSPDVGEKRNQLQSELKPGEVLLLENLRFSEEEKSKDSKIRNKRAEDLRRGCDLAVLDAAATLHRDKDVSVYEMISSAQSIAGPTVMEFIESVQGILKPGAKTMAIFGGSKMADKAEAMLGLAGKVETFCVLGLPSIAFHFASGIKEVGKYKPADEEIEIAKQIVNKRKSFDDSSLLVSDVFCISKSLDEASEKTKELSEGITEEFFTPDVAVDYLDKVLEQVKKSDTVFVNGTPGIWESELHNKGSKYLIDILEKSGKTIVFGGGDATGSADKFSNNSDNLIMITAGGATMEALAKGWQELAGVRALGDSELL